MGNETENELIVPSPGLVEKIHRLIFSSRRDHASLQKGLHKLEKRYKASVYSELLFLLANLRFEPDTAKKHWKGIVAHRRSMEKALDKPMELLVSLVSYFLEVDQKLKNPILIEFKLYEQTRESAYKDELTRLCNFRYFREHLNREIHRSQRYKDPLSLVMIDIDNFKRYNDCFGHEAGNEALTAIATLLSDSLRKVDVAARYGGEEFTLILPSTGKESAFRVAERARKKIETFSFPLPNDKGPGKLTVSIGIATCPADGVVSKDLIGKADSAMYAAKARGKNCIRFYGQDRRSFRRIGASMDGKFCVLAAEYHPMTTINISEVGLRFQVDRQIPVGTRIDVILMPPSSEEEINFSGRVVRLEAKMEGKFEGAIQIVEITTQDRIRLSEFVNGLRKEQTAGAAQSDKQDHSTEQIAPEDIEQRPSS
ncbi:MAG: diguanylate cyclase [Acidobacteria bacterium]|nr:diguanylate cyclase [Acidobacteriota bacterium]